MSAVRLMRIELGGAFADLLNEKGKGSGDNEMAYVERSLGFRTKELDDRDLRLVLFFILSTFFVIIYVFLVFHCDSFTRYCMTLKSMYGCD